MGLLSSILGAAAPIAGGIFGGPVGSAIGGAVGGMLSSKNSPSSLTSTSQQQLDPRIGNIVFGSNGNNGLLSQYQGMLNTPQSQGLQNYGQTANDYLTHYGSSDLNAAHNTASGLMGGNASPTAAIGAYAHGNMVQAPNQNNIDLTGSYKNLLSGGDTTALNNSMNAAVNATNAGFNTNVANLTNNLQRNVLPGISQNSVLAGQYGGSRQGIAQGLAISDYTNQLNNANTQLAATNSANTTAQAANAYQQGQDRALTATQGLGAQQYGVASQNANTANQAEFMNVGNAQQTALANQAAQLQTNGQNNGAALGGAGLLGSLGSTAYGTANNDQNYAVNHATQVNGLLAPYLSANQSTKTSQPLYQNTAGNILGGATAGLGLYNMFSGMGGNGLNATANASTGSAGMLLNPSQMSPMSAPSLPMWNG